jgi:hypothetical protein
MLFLPVLWSIFLNISGPQIWVYMGEHGGYGGIQRDTAGYSGMWEIHRESGIQRDTAGYSGIQRDTIKI